MEIFKGNALSIVVLLLCATYWFTVPFRTLHAIVTLLLVISTVLLLLKLAKFRGRR